MGPRRGGMARAALLAVVLWVAVAVAAYSTRYGQVSVGTGSASQIGSTTGRRSLCWSNTSSTNTIYCAGTSGVTSGTGMPMPPGDKMCSNDPSAAEPVYCIAVGGSAVVGFKENAE
jgi:hypothetical protein